VPYLWEADEMALWLKPTPEAGRAAEVALERQRCSFSLAEGQP
jgi:hypothetical protein